MRGPQALLILQEMFKTIKELIVTGTGKDTSIVFTATIINAVIGGLFFIIVPRFLGPSNYGLFAVVVSTGVLVSNIAHFGIDTGILRFANHIDQIKSNKILKLAFQTYLVIGVLTFIIGFFLSPLIAKIIGNASLAPLLKIAFLGTILTLFTDYFIVYLQTKREFAKASFVNISSNLARLILLAIAMYFLTVGLYFVTLLFFLIPVVSILVGKIFVPLDFLKTQGQEKEFKKFFTFNFWIFATLVISTIPFDNYFLVNLAGPVSTGIYAAPYKIVSISDQFAGNFSRVLASRFASFKNYSEAQIYAVKTLPIIVSFFLIFSLGGFISAPIFNILFGSQYAPSVTVFRILSLGFAFYFANTTAVSLIIYFFSQSKITFFITLINKSLWAVFSFILISKYQETGAAVAFLISAVISFVLFNLYAIYKLRIART